MTWISFVECHNQFKSNRKYMFSISNASFIFIMPINLVHFTFFTDSPKHVYDYAYAFESLFIYTDLTKEYVSFYHDLIEWRY